MCEPECAMLQLARVIDNASPLQQLISIRLQKAGRCSAFNACELLLISESSDIVDNANIPDGFPVLAV